MWFPHTSRWQSNHMIYWKLRFSGFYVTIIQHCPHAYKCIYKTFNLADIGAKNRVLNVYKSTGCARRRIFWLPLKPVLAPTWYSRTWTLKSDRVMLCTMCRSLVLGGGKEWGERSTWTVLPQKTLCDCERNHSYHDESQEDTGQHGHTRTHTHTHMHTGCIILYYKSGGFTNITGLYPTLML